MTGIWTVSATQLPIDTFPVKTSYIFHFLYTSIEAKVKRKRLRKSTYLKINIFAIFVTKMTTFIRWLFTPRSAFHFIFLGKCRLIQNKSLFLIYWSMTYFRREILESLFVLKDYIFLIYVSYQVFFLKTQNWYNLLKVLGSFSSNFA